MCQAGDYTFTLQAVYYDKSATFVSTTVACAEPYSYTNPGETLQAPTNVRQSGRTIVWDAYPDGADKAYVGGYIFDYAPHGEIDETYCYDLTPSFDIDDDECLKDENIEKCRIRWFSNDAREYLSSDWSEWIDIKNQDAPPVITYTVTFNENSHGTAPAAQTIKNGEKVTKPTDPTASGYTFGGWYTESECQNAYDFATPVTEDIILYAKWTEQLPTTPVMKFDTDRDGKITSGDIIRAMDIFNDVQSFAKGTDEEKFIHFVLDFGYEDGHGDEAIRLGDIIHILDRFNGIEENSVVHMPNDLIHYYIDFGWYRP